MVELDEKTMSSGADKVHELTYELKVSDVMSKNPVVVVPGTSMPEVRTILKEKRIAGAPVVEDNRLVGIVSIEDLIRWLSDGSQGGTVKDVMSRSMETIFSDELLVFAATKLGQTGFGRLPVIDRDTGLLAGIITKGDIIKGVLRKLRDDYTEEEIHKYRASHIFEDIVATDATVQLRYTIPGGNLKEGGACSSCIKKTISRLGINPAIVRRTAIASYEAELNTIIYSNGGIMSVSISPNKIQLQLKDKGPGIKDIEKAMQPGYSTAPDWVREMGFGAGMGLNNIKNNVDEMNLDSAVGEGVDLKMLISY